MVAKFLNRTFSIVILLPIAPVQYWTAQDYTTAVTIILDDISMVTPFLPETRLRSSTPRCLYLYMRLQCTES